jgi:hypothetical protein
MSFQNDIDPHVIVNAICIVNKPLFAGILDGNNENFNIYNLIKGIALEWGLVYKFEVPEDYEQLVQSQGRVSLTFRLMRRVDGSGVPISPINYYRSQLPKINKTWILLVNRKYDLRTHINTTVFVTQTIVHGILIGEYSDYNYDPYNLSLPIIPDPSFILKEINENSAGKSETEFYKNKLTVWNHGAILQIPIEDVHIIENELFYLEASNNHYPFVNSKKFGVNAFIGSGASVRQNNQIAISRIFCSEFINELGEEPGLDDFMWKLNHIPRSELKVLLKNRGVVKGTTSIIANEPDMFDTFTVPYKGNDEIYSIISIEPNYNINDTNNSLTAEYEAVRIA